MKCAVFFLAAAALSIPAKAQSGGKAELFSAAQIREQLTALAPKAAQQQRRASAGRLRKSQGADLGAHHKRGAEIHAHFDDVMIVQQGSATLVTGGTVIDPNRTRMVRRMDPGFGRKLQTISPGDLVTVNAGVPISYWCPPAQPIAL